MFLKGFFLLSLLSIAFCDTYSFESVARPHTFIRTRGWLGTVSKIKTDDDEKDATFKIVPGLADPEHENTISFESVNRKGYFLRHGVADSLLHLSKRPTLKVKSGHQHDAFDTEATFYFEAGNFKEVDSDATCSFRSLTDSHQFIRLSGDKLIVEAGSDYNFQKESTFYPTEPKWTSAEAHGR